MNAKTTAYIFFAGWAIVYALSFILTANTPAKDMGFTRGLNRVTTFVGWQFAAAVLAILVWTYAKSFQPGLTRWMFRTPAILAAALVVFVCGLVLYAILLKPQPSDPYTPPTSTELPAGSNMKTLSGFYRQGFEQSDFYTTDGDGPFWVETSEDVGSQLQAYINPKPGRGSSITVKLQIVGQVTDGGEFGHLGAYSKRIQAERINNVERISPEEYDDAISGLTP